MLSRIGIYLLAGGQAPDNPANRHVRSPNPKANYWQRNQGVCRDYPEVLSRTVSPCLDWIEGVESPSVLDRVHPKTIVIDVERAFGTDEAYSGGEQVGRILGFQEELISRQYDLPYLTSHAFAAAAQPYIAGGLEVVAHSGSPNATDPRGDRWADEHIAAGRGAIVFRELFATDAPLLAAGVRVGRDGMQLSLPSSFNYFYYQLFKRLGGLQQIEASIAPANVHWLGEPCRLRGSLFIERHFPINWVVPQNPNRISGFPKLGTSQFNSLYRDIRVTVSPHELGKDAWADANASDADKKKLIDATAPVVKKMLAASPNLTVLLHHSIIERCVDLQVPVTSFLP